MVQKVLAYGAFDATVLLNLLCAKILLKQVVNVHALRGVWIPDLAGPWNLGNVKVDIHVVLKAVAMVDRGVT